MEIISQLHQSILVQPIYNFLVAVYATIGQSSAGLTFILVGLLSGLVFMPTAIRNYFDQEQVKDLQSEIAAIKTKTSNAEQQQQQILKLLKENNVQFQSESIFLFGQAVVAFLIYPVVIGHWRIEPDWFYSFTPTITSITPDFAGISLNQSSPTASLIPAILLFLELRVAYRQQNFLTSFIDRWYPVILPLFSYFLIFWLPSAISITLASALAVSVYFKYMLQLFTKLRHR
jgi:membrane protein insertase Oxa1/YidC/SpoIIIJ